MNALTERRPVWRGYTQTELDAQCDPRLSVADASPWVEAWRDGSEQARRRTAEVRADLSYGGTGNERFDLYLPTHRPCNLPFAAFVHAVAWRPTARADAGFPASTLQRLGMAFVAIGFDSAPGAGLRRQVAQVRRAWRFLVENAAYFGLDPGRGHLIGHSSGAHLAALAAFDPEAPLPPASAVLLSGVYDLEPVRLSALGGDLGLDRDGVADMSPLRCIPRPGPNLVVAWGAEEAAEPQRQSMAFAEASKLRGLAVKRGGLRGRNHFDTSFELVNRDSQVYATLRAGGW